MERLRGRWWVALVVVAVLGVAIFVASPHYTDVQSAGDAEEFRRAVDRDGGARVAVGAVIDLAFAVAYALLALTVAGRHLASRIGVVLVAVGAAADLVENALVLAGVARGSNLSDGHVDAMLAFGAVKWAGIVGGVLAITIGALLTRRQRAEV